MRHRGPSAGGSTHAAKDSGTVSNVPARSAVILVVAVTALTGAAEVGHATVARSPLHATAVASRLVIYGAGYKPRRFYPDNRTVASGFSWFDVGVDQRGGDGHNEDLRAGGPRLLDDSTVHHIHPTASSVRRHDFHPVPLLEVARARRVSPFPGTSAFGRRSPAAARGATPVIDLRFDSPARINSRRRLAGTTRTAR